MWVVGKEWLSAVLTAALVALAVAQSQSGGNIPSCATKLAACADYLNATTTPPATCCNPLREAVTNEKTCLCNLYNNPDLLRAFQINVTQALNLPKLCHIETGKGKDANICKGTAPSPSSTGSAPSLPGASGSESGGSNRAANKITGAGLVSSLLMFGTYLVFY